MPERRPAWQSASRGSLSSAYWIGVTACGASRSLRLGYLLIGLAEQEADAISMRSMWFLRLDRRSRVTPHWNRRQPRVRSRSVCHCT